VQCARALVSRLAWQKKAVPGGHSGYPRPSACTYCSLGAIDAFPRPKSVPGVDSRTQPVRVAGRCRRCASTVSMHGILVKQEGSGVEMASEIGEEPVQGGSALWVELKRRCSVCPRARFAPRRPALA